jgi:hypothetical protein
VIGTVVNHPAREDERIVCQRFYTHRMVREYAERLYVTGAAGVARQSADDAAEARTLARWRARIAMGWPEVAIDAVGADVALELPARTPIHVRARVALGSLAPADVRVEMYLRRLDAAGAIIEPGTTRLLPPAGAPVLRGGSVVRGQRGRLSNERPARVHRTRPSETPRSHGAAAPGPSGLGSAGRPGRRRHLGAH